MRQSFLARCVPQELVRKEAENQKSCPFLLGCGVDSTSPIHEIETSAQQKKWRTSFSMMNSSCSLAPPPAFAEPRQGKASFLIFQHHKSKKTGLWSVVLILTVLLMVVMLNHVSTYIYIYIYIYLSIYIYLVASSFGHDSPEPQEWSCNLRQGSMAYKTVAIHSQNISCYSSRTERKNIKEHNMPVRFCILA